MRTYLFLLLSLASWSCTNESTTEAEALPETTPAEYLITSPDAAVPLAAFSVTDTARLIPAYSMSPMATIDITTVIPRAEDEALNALLRKDIADIIAGEEATLAVTDLRQSLMDAVRTTLYNYQQQDIDSTEVGASPSIYALEKSYQTKVLYNEGNFLSLAVSEYVYAGGAHGNFVANLLTYAVAEKQLLTLENLFVPTALPRLGELIKSKIDPDRLYAPEDVVAVSDNFVLTADGILFNYPPYAIGPYAAGEIEVLLPYAEVVEALNPAAKKLLSALLPPG